MLRKVTWEAITLYNSLFSFLHPFIIKLDPKRRKVSFQRSKSVQFRWFLSLVINLVILLGGTNVYVFTKWYLFPGTVAPAKLIGAFITQCIGMLIGYISVIHVTLGAEHSLGVNCLLRLHAKLMRRQELNKMDEGTAPNNRLKYKIIGTILKAMVWGFALVPFTLVPLAVYENLDPHKILLLDLIPPKWLDQHPIESHIGLFFGRILILLVIATEIARFYACTFLLLMAGILIYMECLDTLHETDLSADTLRRSVSLVPEYRQCQVLISILNPILKLEIQALMFIGFWIAVFAIIVTVQGYNLFPIQLYIFFPSIGVFTLIFIYATLPFGTESHEKTLGAVEKWKGEVSRLPGHHFKLATRTLRSLRHISVYCGNLFLLQKETKSTYFSEILNYSVDLTISMNLEKLLNKGAPKQVGAIKI